MKPILMNSFSVRAILGGRKTQTRRVITPQPDVSGGKIIFPWATFYPGGYVHTYNEDGIGGQNWPAPEFPDENKFQAALARTPYKDPCPYGVPGDRLWVREAWQLCSYGSQLPGLKEFRVRYRVDDTLRWVKCERDLAVLKTVGFKPSIFMPREFSRLTLEITSVGVERIQEISKQDAIAEGVDWRKCPMYQTEAQLRHMVKGWGTAMTVDYIDGFKRLWNSINASPGLSWADNPWVWVVEFERIQ
jgi:hypothetical protein